MAAKCIGTILFAEERIGSPMKKERNLTKAQFRDLKEERQTVQSMGVLPFGLPGPLSLKRNCHGLHVKYII